MWKTLTDSLRSNMMQADKAITCLAYTGHVLNIQKEDGSGNCFNVTMLLTKPCWLPRMNEGEKVTFFVRVKD